MPLPILKTDKSGGFMVISITNGEILHKMRVHVLPFVTGGTITAPIPNDAAYTPTHPEGSVGQTFFNLAVCLRGMYSSTFSIALTGLYQNSAPGVGNGVVAPVFPFPRPPRIQGTSGGTNDWLAGQVTLSFPSSSGGKARIVMLSSQEWFPTGRPGPEFANLNGTPVQITTAYLVGKGLGSLSYNQASIISGQANVATVSAPTAIVAHDGGEFVDACRRTVCLNHRVRRSLHYT